MKTLAPTMLLALALFATPAFAQAQRPDTEFCARMRVKDPGGICTAKGEYVTADKVYLPDGKVVNRTTGS